MGGDVGNGEGRIREQFLDGLIRSGRWKQTIEGILVGYGVPTELAALPHVESSYNPAALSKAGAAGVWQFTRGTGSRYLRIDRYVDERRDVYVATHAAAQYLKAGRMPATLANVRKVYAERAQVMCDALRHELGSAIEFVQPQGGLFVWARLTGADGKVGDGSVLAKLAIDKGVAFVPGAPFYCANPDHATLRLSFATVGVDKIVEGVGRLAQAL